jgi:hypothetical protein
MPIRHLLWSPWHEPGLEHVQVSDSPMVVADGLIISIVQGVPYRLRYRIQCDAAWQVQEVALHLLMPRDIQLHLNRDNAGMWYPSTGEAASALTGCTDVDISATPLTNTLPIRRLQLVVGQSAEIAVVYIAVPALTITSEHQRYTCLEQHQQGSLYRYESLASGFTATLPVDRDGFVLDYPDLFRRVWQS